MWTTRINLAALVLLSSMSIFATADAPTTAPATRPADVGFVPLFPDKGVPKGWTVRLWSDVSKPPKDETAWKVDDDGVLHGGESRGTWLVSEKEYGDFILDFEFKLGPQGNSGCGLRFPAAGDPAFDGLEVQMADARYNDGRDGPDKLTGSLYKALAPSRQVYKPTEWNHYVIACEGPRVRVVLNGEVIQDVDLDAQKAEVLRHNNAPAPTLKDRPRKGHIGFQELSRGGGHVQIRNARIKELPKPEQPR